MNIWVFMGRYDGELFASTHLTEKGAVLAGIFDLLEYLGVHDKEDARASHEDEDKTLPWDPDEIKALPTSKLWEIYKEYCEHTWDDYSYEIEIHQTQVVG